MSGFVLEEARTTLQSTPAVLRATLLGLPERLLHADEGEGTWSPFQVVCHLAHGETDDWLPRIRLILEHGESRAFTPFEREAGFVRYAAFTPAALLAEFTRLRAANLSAVDALGLTGEQLERLGRHPELGRVTLRQLLACWATHDMAHLAQIARVLCRAHGAHVGPWREYFSLLREAQLGR